MGTISKQDFIRRVGERSGVSLRDTRQIVDIMLFTIEEAIKRDERVTLTGFGTFEPRRKNGQRTIGFKSSGTLKDVVREQFTTITSQHVIPAAPATATTPPAPSPVDAAQLLEERDDPPQVFAEGAIRQVIMDSRERNPAARTACLEVHGRNCAVCGMNFEQRYGAVGRGYIHVHHLRPLGDAAGERQVDPVNDLRPVCPNCHAMLHQRQPPYSIEELQSLLSE